jgi:hypothetical protein
MKKRLTVDQFQVAIKDLEIGQQTNVIKLRTKSLNMI